MKKLKIAMIISSVVVLVACINAYTIDPKYSIPIMIIGYVVILLFLYLFFRYYFLKKPEMDRNKYLRKRRKKEYKEEMNKRINQTSVNIVRMEDQSNRNFPIANYYNIESSYRDRKYIELKDDSMPRDYIVFDTETTGLEPCSERIIEIGAIKYINHIKIDEYNQLIYPEMRVSNFITDLTGITNRDLIEQPLFKDVYMDFIDFIEDLPLIAHNAPFDIKMVAAELDRINEPMFRNLVINTVSLAKKAIPKGVVENHKLTTLKEYFGLEYNSHRAIDDCEVCATLYQYYCTKKEEKLLKERKGLNEEV